MKIVITGALGHIGSRLIRDLVDFYPNLTIVMLDNMMAQRHNSLFNLSRNGTYLFAEEDVTKCELHTYFKSANVVIHLAAITNAVASIQYPDRIKENNYTATDRVATACLKLNLPLIYLSTTSVYGSQASQVDETCVELYPQSPYATSKLEEEQLLKQYSQMGLRYIICRFGTIAGVSPGMRFHTAVNKFCWQAATHQAIAVWKTALYQRRPYLHLDDAVKAIRFIIDQELYDQGIYNIVSQNLTVNDILEFIRSVRPKIIVQLVEYEIMNQLSYEVLSKKISDRGLALSGKISLAVNDTLKMLCSL